MTRITGIQLLALSVVLWGLAVWIFHAPESTATVHPTSAQTDLAPAAGDPARVEDASTPPPRPVEPREPDATVASVASGADAAHPAPGAAVASTPSPEPPAPRPAAEGESRIALAPAQPGAYPSAPGTAAPRPPVTPGGGDRAGQAPMPRHDPYPRGAPDDARSAGVASPPPRTRFDYPTPYGRPPPRPGSGISGSGAVVVSEFSSARRAAWEGRLSDSLDHYRAAARIEPDNHAVWGEMGNVLWEMGRWSEAAYALEGAATLLVEAGELQAASRLVPAVGNIDPAAARRLQQLLMQATAQRYPG